MPSTFLEVDISDFCCFLTRFHTQILEFTPCILSVGWSNREHISPFVLTQASRGLTYTCMLHTVVSKFHSLCVCWHHCPAIALRECDIIWENTQLKATWKQVWWWPVLLLDTFECSPLFCSFIHARLEAVQPSAASLHYAAIVLASGWIVIKKAWW